MDYLYIQGIPFHHSISQSNKFRITEALRAKKKPNNSDIIAKSKRAINIYHAREITIEQVNVDNEFSVLVDEIMPIPINIVGTGEHVGNTERSNLTIKERTRSHIHCLPF